MKNTMQKTAIITARLLMVLGFIFFFQTSASSQIVLNNSKLRFGTGAEASVNNTGNLQQPFYYNSVLSVWRKLTYSSYSLDNAFAIGGVKTNEWNLNGTMVQNPVLSNQIIDLNGYVATSATTGYGTIVSTGTTVIGGQLLEIRNTYTLPQNNAYITVTTRLRNISSALMENVRIWIGTRDDWVGDTDGPRKQKGNLVNGAFAQVSSSATRAAAIQITSGSEGVLFYTNSTRGNTVVNSCCQFTNVTNQDPSTSTVDITNDGSYAFYVRMNDLAVGDVDEFTWYYAAGELANLNTIINQVAVAGAVSNITYTSATLTAKTPVASTGYWMVVPSGSATPSPAQIKTGANYGAVTVVSSGSGPMTANVDAIFTLSGLSANTPYIVHFVSQAADLSYSSQLAVPFTTQAYTVPTVSTSAVSSVTAVTAASGGNVTNSGGQNIIARGVCWNTSASPTIANSKTIDGSGTGIFSSSLSGLLPSTTYYLRAYATNATGTSYGNEIVFTTGSQIPAGALDFGGADDYVNLGAPLASNASYTREAWVFNGNPGFPNNNIFSTFNDPVYIPGGYLNVTQGNSSGVVDPDPFPVSTWTHVAVTYDKPTTTLKLYVNGVLKATNTNAPAFTGGTLYLGKHPTGGGSSSVGMDEVRFWNRALCREEILNNMNAAISGPQSGLVALYNFNQGFVNANNAGVTTLTDASGNGNNGTLVGFTLSGSSSNWIAGTVTGTAAPFVASVAPITGTTTLCVGATSTLANANTGGSWTSSNPSVAGISAAGVVTALAPGTAIITYTNSCGGVSTTTVTVNALPTVSVAGTNTICAGQATTITASGGGSYLWSNNETTAAINVSPVTTTAYTVTVTSAAGCVATGSRTVTVNALPTITNVTGTSTVCYNATTTLTANSAATGAVYNWYAASTGGSPLFTGQSYTTASLPATTTFYVGVTNASGCTSPRTAVTVTVNPDPTVTTVADQVVCAGSTVSAINFSGTVPGTKFTWTSNTSLVGLAASGTGNIASFTGTNNTSLPITASVTVTPSTGATGTAYISQAAKNSVAIIDLGTNTVLGTIPVGNSPLGLSVSPDETKVYVVNQTNGSVSVINTSTNVVTATISGLNSPQGVVVSPDGNHIYTTNAGNSSVIAINTNTNLIDATRTVNSFPNGITVSPDGSRIYVTNLGAGNVSVINTSNFTIAATITVGSSPRGIVASPDGSKVYVANSGSNFISVINTATNTASSIAMSNPSWGLAISKDGSILYTGNQSVGGVGGVTAVNTATGAIVGSVVTDNQPYALSLTSDGSKLYVANFGYSTVSVVNTATLTKSNQISLATNSAPLFFGNFIVNGSAVCTGIAKTFTVTVNPKPSANISALGSTNICPGTAVTLQANTGSGYTYQWKKGGADISGATGATYAANATGTYTVVITNSYGCVSAVSNAIDVTVADIVPPVFIGVPQITTPLNANGNVTASSLQGAVVNYSLPAASDNCSGSNVSVVATPASGSLFPMGTTQVTYVATDAAGLSTTGTFTITVSGALPVINCPGNIVVNSTPGQCGAIVNFAATETAGIPASVITYSVQPGSFFAVGTTHTVTATATNAVGSSACTFTITVVDNIYPILMGVPANVTVPCNAVPAVANVTATDNCSTSAPVFTEVRTEGDCPNNYILTRTWSTTDASGNITTASQVITVQDTQAPAITNIADITVPAAEGLCSAVVNYTAIATDNCGAASINYSIAPGSTFTVGSHLVTVTATDVCGNVSTASFTVTVTDAQRPVIVCAPNQIVNLSATCSAVVPDYRSLLTVSDNCTAANALLITQSPAAGTVVNGGGNFTVTFTVTDAAGNSSNCSMTVTKRDVTAPVLTIPADAVLECDASRVPTGPTNSVTYNSLFGNFDPYTENGLTTTILFGHYHNYLGYNLHSGYSARWTATAGNFTLKSINVTMGQFTLTASSGATVTTTTTGVFTLPNTAQWQNLSYVNFQALTESAVKDVVFGSGTSMGGAQATDGCDNNPVITYTDDNSGLTGCNGTGILKRTWTATDASGNTTSAMQNITIQDTKAPVFVNCVSNIIVNSTGNNCSAIVTWIAPTATDNCGTPVLTSNYQSGASFPVGVTTVTYTATDACGNTSTCSFTVTVRDATPPVIVCTPNQTINLSATCSAALPDYRSLLTVSDNCTVAGSLMISQSPAAGTVINGLGNMTVNFTVTDAAGNSSNCSMTVTKRDVTAPIITGPANKQVNTDANLCGAVVKYAPDNAIVFSQDFVSGPTNSTYCNAWTTFTNQLVAGNTYTKLTIKGTYDQTGVSVTDPAIIAQIAAALKNGSNGTWTTNGRTWAVGNCGGPGALSATNGYVCNCDQNGYVVRPCIDVQYGNPNWGGVNTATCNGPSQNITVVFEMSGGGNGTGGITATDACNGPVTITQTAGLASGSLFPVGTTTNTFTATDASGNTSSYSFDVTVTDNQRPTITAPVARTVNNAPGTCGATVNLGTPVTADNCGVATVTNNAPAIFPIGTTTVTWTVTDVNGNSQTATQSVTVIDNQPPVIVCPADIDVYATSAAGAVVNYTAPVGTDNCTGVTTIRIAGPASGSVFPIGSTTISYRATDAAGLTATCSFTVTVTGLPPVIDCPANIAVTATAGQCGTNVTFAATESTAIPASAIVYTENGNAVSSGSFFTVGIHTITATATNPVGSSVCTFTITVTDTETPVIITPANIAVNNDAGVCGAQLSIVPPAATDNCGIASVIGVRTDGLLLTAAYPVGVTGILWTATDVNGLTSSHTQTVTVTDNEAPIVITQNVTILLNASGNASITTAQINNGSTDNCGIASYSLNKTSFNCSNLGNNTVTLTVTDIHGNSSTATAVVTVKDNLAPVPVVTNLPVITAQCAVTLTAPKAVDNCAGTVMATSANPISYTAQGTYSVTWIYQDGNGNSSSQQQTVIVKDNTAPVVVTQNITVPLDATGHVTVTPAQVDNGSSDNCTPVTLAFATGYTTGTICATANEGGTLVLTAPVGAVITGINFASYGTPTGSCGNFVLGACNAAGSKAIVENYALGQNSVAIPVNNGVFGDPCYGTVKRLYVQATYLLTAGNASTAASASFDCSNIGTNTVTLLVSDANGNQSVKQATITVKDLTAPIVVAQDITVPLNAAGTASITAADINNGSTDACGILSMTVSQNNFTCANIGANTVTLTVTDVNGNVSSGAAIVTIVDQIAPTVITNNITIQLSANGTASITTAQINNGSTDNCTIASYSLDKTSFNCANVGANTVTLTVTDVNGNSATQTAIVTVVDQIAPTVLTNNMTIQLDANGAAAITTAQINNNATDNCSIATYSLDKTSFDCSNVGQNTVTLTVTDVNGNSASQTATVTVIDNTAPIVTAAAAQVFCANASGSNQYTITTATARDNCSIATITYAVTGATSRTGTGYDASGAFNIGTSTITWTVTDVNGNSSTGSTTVVVNPLPVATYVSSNADAFCNQTSLTASSSINPALYSWSASNTPGSFSANPVLSLGLTNADGNYYLYTQSSVTGCVSASAAVYNFQKQNLSSSYTILAYKEVELGKYNKVLSGSVGVMTAKGEAEFKSYSGVTGAGSFVKAPKIDKDGSGITLNSQLIGIAAVSLPTMQYNTASTNNLPSVTASSNSPLSGNYKNLTVKKGISVTVSGNTFGNIRLEEGASIRFTSTVLNIENFTADRGAKNNDYTYIHFAPNTSVRVGNKVSIGSQVLLNPESYKVSFYMGDERKDEEKFTVKGGDTRVIANILMPNGKLRVTATDSDDDDDKHGDCDHKAHSSKDCKHRGHEHNDCSHSAHTAANCQDDVYMTGLFIAEEVESKGNKVIWNSYDCSAPAAPITSVNSNKGVTQSVSAEKVAATSEEELKVTVMPNPSTTYFTLKLESKYETPVNLRVMDGAGRVVDARSKLGSNSTFQIGHSYSSGTYYAELIQGTKRKVVQLIKARG